MKTLHETRTEIISTKTPILIYPDGIDIIFGIGDKYFSGIITNSYHHYSITNMRPPIRFWPEL